MSLRNSLAELSDDNVAAIEELLANCGESIGLMLAIAFSLASARPVLAFRTQAALARRPEPSEPDEREQWLRAHNNACHFAVFHGEQAEKRDVVERALPVAADNPAIYYNVACVLCLLGEAERAIEAIRGGINSGYDDATVKAISEDADLDLIRHTEAFQAIIQGRTNFQLPTWAAGWTAGDVIQFRELFRSTSDELDLTDFDAGRIAWHGQEIDIVALAELCKGKPLTTWSRIVTPRLLLQIPHLRA